MNIKSVWLNCVCCIAAMPTVVTAQVYIEYPGHPATYGDHIVNSVWDNGPAIPTVSLETDEAILHDDGNGQSQRTARNTLTFTAPSSPANPQNFDNLFLVNRYGNRFPQLQQMSANGTSTLTYEFDSPVSEGLDLFITDVDSSDSVLVRAFTQAAPIDMTSWELFAEGDLSLHKDTGTEFSDIVAPTPIALFSQQAISLIAVNDTNYNRSFSVLRATNGVPVERIEIEFTGTRNSANREAGGNASHIYVAVVVGKMEVIPGDVNCDGTVNLLDVSPFITTLGSGKYNEKADMNQDGVVNLLDVDLFIIALAG